MKKPSEFPVGTELLVVYDSQNTGKRARRIKVVNYTCNGTLVKDLDIQTGNNLRLFKDERVGYLHEVENQLKDVVTVDTDVKMTVYDSEGRFSTFNLLANNETDVYEFLDNFADLHNFH